ncbi:hypothetical protein [Bacillus litorisediminis]|uniref:hypothetical protein n=1 Tax=Bacillus litorisediminis TaxID=2922713 RepID=UPI001FAE3D4F|nr:hypothetical protein [Bacillus litorisediminis]
MEDKVFLEEPVSIEELKKELKDELPSAVIKAINKHNDIINSINAFEENLDALTPFQIAKLEHYYNKAEREAWKIAGYYKSQYQYYFGKASTERGKFYIHERETNKCTVNDSNYRSKIQEGINQEISGIYEGYYVTWKGIAHSYNGMQLTYKDMIKAIKKEDE